MNDETRKQSPIFSKTSDFILWLLDHTEKYPKSERFRLARRLEDSAFAFYDLLIQAARSKQKRRILLQADLELDKLRLYMRMAQQRRLASQSQYRFASGSLVEMGRLLGGWLKSLPGT
jgi:hypothetical protein